MTDRSSAKRRAAELAVDRVESGMVIGLGTGSTAGLAVEELGRRLATGALRNVLGVATSRATARLAAASGVPLTRLDDRPVLDLAIDGADEVDPEGRLVKGAGGALLWEKIVARAATRFVVAVDRSKLVDRLGRRAPVPVEVVPFGWVTHVEPIRFLGAEPVLRMGQEGTPFRTDEGHFIIDARFPEGLPDPERIERVLRRRAGIVETGLFLDFEPEVVVGD